MQKTPNLDVKNPNIIFKMIARLHNENSLHMACSHSHTQVTLTPKLCVMCLSVRNGQATGAVIFKID